MTRIRKACPASSTRPLRILTWGLFLIACPMVATAAEPAPAPTRYVPSKGLAAYVEYDGIDAHAEAWKATAAYAILHRTTAGEMTAEVARQVIDRMLKSAPGTEIRGADLLHLLGRVAGRGLSLAIYDEGDGRASGVLVLNGLGRVDARERFERMVRLLGRVDGEDPSIATTRFRGRDFYQMRKKIAPKPEDDFPVPPAPEGLVPERTAKAALFKETWWFEGDDLILVEGPARVEPASPAKPGEAKPDALAKLPPTLPVRVADVLDTIEGTQTSVATHPGRVAALAEGGDIKGFEASGLFFVDVSRNHGLLTGLIREIGAADPSYAGLTLPSGKHMHDDVQYFPPGPDLPYANTQAKPTPPPAVTYSDASPPVAPPVAPGIGPGSAPPVPIAVPDLPPLPTTLEPVPGQKGAEIEAPSQEAAPKPVRDPLQYEPILAKLLGSNQIRKVVGRWGFQGKALVTDVRVEAPAPRRMSVGMFDQPGLRKDRLPPIPRDAGCFLIGSFDPRKIYDAYFLAAARSTNEEFKEADEKFVEKLKKLIEVGNKFPSEDLKRVFKEGLEQVKAMEENRNEILKDMIKAPIEQAVRDATGLRLREDLLAHLGPTWSLYKVSVGDRGQADPAVPTLIVDVDDAEAFGKLLDTLTTRGNAYFRELQRGEDNAGEPGDDPPALLFERLPAPERGCRLISPAGDVAWLDEEMSPTILLDKSHVVFAANPALARAAAAAAGHAGRWAPTGELVESFACLPPDLTSLSVATPADSSWPEAFANLPGVVQLLATQFGLVWGDVAEASPASKFLAFLGVPRPGAFRLRIDRARVPKADALRNHLFPSVLATMTDDRGFRLISREAFPFGCLGIDCEFKTTTQDGGKLRLGLKSKSFSGFKTEIKLP